MTSLTKWAKGKLGIDDSDVGKLLARTKWLSVMGLEKENLLFHKEEGRLANLQDKLLFKRTALHRLLLRVHEQIQKETAMRNLGRVKKGVVAVRNSIVGNAKRLAGFVGRKDDLATRGKAEVANAVEDAQAAVAQQRDVYLKPMIESLKEDSDDLKRVLRCNVKARREAGKLMDIEADECQVLQEELDEWEKEVGKAKDLVK